MKTSKNTTAILLERRAVKIGLAGFFCLLIAFSSMAQPANKCLSFNGTTSVVNFTDEVKVPTQNNNLLVSAWVNWHSKADAGSSAVIMTLCDSAGKNGQYWLQHSADNTAFQFVFQTDSLVKITVNSTTNPVEGNWYSVVGEFDGTYVNLYVNGFREGHIAIPAGQHMNAPDTSYNLILGASASQTNQFNGLLDEVAVWNRNHLLISQHSVYDMMCISLNYGETGLASYWKMDSLVNDSIYDTVIGGDGGGDLALDAIGSNITIVNGGVPVAINLTHVTGSSPFVYINSTTGDSLIIDSLNYAPDGVYVYQINGTSADTSLPTGVTSACTSYYYGIFIPGYQGGNYTVTYYYANTSCAGHRQSAAVSPVLLNRNVQTSFNWVVGNTTIDLSSSKFSMVLQGGQNEFILGSQTNNTTGITNGANSSLKVNGISPNPFLTNFSIAINCRKNTNIKARVMGADGKFILERILSCNQGENQLNFENMSEMANGVYFLNLSDGEGYTANVKMIKN